MADVTIFDPIPWRVVGVSVLQTVVMFALIITGLKMVGRRVFGELGPQELVVLLLISESANLGLGPQEGGFWAAAASVLTILALAGLVERIAPLRQFIEDHAVVLLEKGRPKKREMKENLVDEEDLKAAARKYGVPGPEAFELMTLESDGSISGVLKAEYMSQPTTRQPDMTSEKH